VLLCAFPVVMSDTAAIHVDLMDFDKFPGYRAIDVRTRPDGLSAYLVLAGKPSCVFGDDIEKLLLNVDYETCKLHRPNHVFYLRIWSVF
jgi:hypothetical protein